jgi:hypothetical protein
MFINNTEKETVDRLSLLFVLETYRYPFSKKSLIEFIMDNAILKYFEMHQLLYTLLENQLIEEVLVNPEIHYQLTEDGRISLAFFKDRMPLDLQNTIIDLVSIIPIPSIFKNEIHTSFIRHDDDDYEVQLELHENKKRIMALSFNVVNQQQVDQIISRWERDSEYLYGDIIALLTK